ncbi:helix-turn-helix transcriptional regulator [Actinomadura fibrosa]|uniref:LuxR C-terminal-related transcriptional regulator n=1 Tax=Actinomadura fibrosa TaxID=111802 RepID=A0ABW2XFJ8_9ACTN|nr:LuxR family transcriptional regulator [Actinomadura fibrosa]
MSLIEREIPESQLDDVLAEAARGQGAVAVLGGPPATGKTALLWRLAERAAAAGAVVLSATGSGEEHGRPYGTLGQLFPDAGTAWRDPARALHAAVTDLAARATVLIIVDDLQHTDEESLRCLRYLTHRITSDRVAVVMAWENRLGQEQSPTLQELVYRPNVRWLHLRPLSQDGVRRLVAERHGPAGAAAKAAAYHALTGGNPLLTAALLRDNTPAAGTARPAEKAQGSVVRKAQRGAEAKEGSGSGAAAGEVVGAGPAYAQAVLVCLHRMGPEVTRIARNVALLDDPVDPHLLARLTGAGGGLVRRTVRHLTEAGLLDGPRFRHPAARQAILEGLHAKDEAELRRRAARLLHDEGAPAGTVARQLLHAGPLKEDWVPPVLEEAARQALHRGDVACAVRCLRIASESCTVETERYSLKAKLAAVHWLVRPATSAPAFTALKAPIMAGKVRPDCALEVAQAMLWYLRFDDAADVIGRVGEPRAGDPGTAVMAGITRLTVETMFPGVGTGPRTAPAADAERPPPMAAPELRALETLSAVLRQSADDQVIAQAEQVLQGSHCNVGSLMAIGPSLLSLIYADRLESAAAWCDRFLADTGTPDGSDGEDGAWQTFLGGFSALVALRTGHLDAAVERAGRVLDRIGRHGWNATTVLALATQAEAYTALGDHAAAAGLFAEPVPVEVFSTTAGLHYLYARGRHHLANEREHAALADFMACGEHMLHWDIDTPSLVPWRTAAAEARLRLGEHDGAADLAAEQLGGFRAELPRARGMTLRCLAAASPPERRPGILESALRPLERSGARYELAQALTDLGAAYHELGDRPRAQAATRRARRLAKSCNARDLYEEAPAPHAPVVRATGGGRVIPIHHSDAYGDLSDSERRVALLAVQGFSNREIAGKLFVTVSTVEQHLTRVYRKMKVRNRAELPTVLRLEDVEAV